MIGAGGGGEEGDVVGYEYGYGYEEGGGGIAGIT